MASERDKNPDRIRRMVRRACTHREMRDLLLEVIDSGAPMRLTSDGVLVYGPQGRAGTHFTCSDVRAAKNFRSALRRIGAMP